MWCWCWCWSVVVVFHHHYHRTSHTTCLGQINRWLERAECRYFRWRVYSAFSIFLLMLAIWSLGSPPARATDWSAPDMWYGMFCGSGDGIPPPTNTTSITTSTSTTTNPTQKGGADVSTPCWAPIRRDPSVHTGPGGFGVFFGGVLEGIGVVVRVVVVETAWIRRSGNGDGFDGGGRGLAWEG